MMFNYPFLNLPYYKFNPFNRHYYYSGNNYNQISEPTLSNKNSTQNEYQNCNDEPSHEKRDYFEILGVKLYSDDILILCLLFFLYNEGVKDTELFISLILLLLS